LLGSFELTCDGRLVLLPASAQRLVAFVALKRHPVQRLCAAGSLWPDASERRAAASLRSAIWRLGRAAHGVLVADGKQLRLAPSVYVDLHDGEERARRILEGRDEIHVGLELRGLRSDLLPDWYDDWVLMEREYFRQLRLRALEVACDRLAEAGRLDEALSAGLAALECEPLRESAHRALVGVHLAQGNVAEAVRQYNLCRSLLETHVGVGPSQELSDMIRVVMMRRQADGGLERKLPGKGRAA
jgi:DNA-binding SARP family transcriptional activator